MSKKNKLDQYYTKASVAELCWNLIDEVIGRKPKYVEPSAGLGVWLSGDRNIKAYDLEPKHNSIEKQDWLEFTGDLRGHTVVGNPPFGFSSSLAIKFINRSFELGADYVCFILPKTFMKKLFVDKNLTRKSELIFESELPKYSFILDGEPYDVPCVFQIYKCGHREPIVYTNFLTKGSYDDYDFIMRRVGGRAGRELTLEEYTPSSSLLVKGDVRYLTTLKGEIVKVSSMTAGVKSITLAEINYLITNSLN